MAADFLPGLLDFAWKHKFIVGFYLAVAFFVYLKRSRFQFYFKVAAVWRTNFGISMMDKTASRYRELVKLFGYVGMGAGFISMFVIVFFLFSSVITLVQKPDSPAQLSPIIPGVHIPGTPEEFYIPFVEGIIAIFIVAVVHEFAHGVVARAHNIRVKSSGPAIFGPVFAAFVELDEKQAKRKDDVVNYSIFAAGSFSNFLLAFAVVLFLSLVWIPAGSSVFSTEAVVLKSVDEGKAGFAAGLEPGMRIASLNGESIKSPNQAIQALWFTRPNETVVFGTDRGDFAVVAGQRPDSQKQGHFGIRLEPVIKHQETFFFRAFSWIQRLLAIVGTLSLGIGLANMIPVGPIDGGRMAHLALRRLRGEKKANRTFVKVSIILLLVILFLLTPIFRELIRAAASVFG